ncbi:hypothetical protein GCM10017691_23900 [Pseudonocardia petroleophila]|uniref:Phage head-tail joining protein n=1 Tax=Pseudonocardia petroleophila TaxID=37331 RepID=A0A7G7MFV3_9PSEU|nr:hypothetical protein [Pseudonocardia petroleophila]QNG51664.1 hypothetical protein H6H00_26750 [Pseudonocardia petroleophila]
MSWFIPTTTVTLKRGETTDEFGDAVDGNTVVASGLPCAVTQSRGLGDQRSFVPSEARGGVVETFTLRFRPNVHVEEQDRVLDERQGLVYQVISVYNPQSVVGAADVRVTAIRVGAVSRPVNG